jgi:hypothetical protein
MHVISGILLSLLQLSNAVPLSDFYPYGANTTDDRLSPNDDDSFRIQLSISIPFFGTGHNSIFVSIIDHNIHMWLTRYKNSFR